MISATMSMLYSSDPSENVLCSNDSSANCAPCVWTNLSAPPASILDSIPVSEDPRTQVLRIYSYGMALPTICGLGIIGNIFNLIVLTRKNMRGTAYIYMRVSQLSLKAEHTAKQSKEP
ncbi:uncharacterized protein LOC125505482 [Dendroctonus ponderosae]|uniref:uncharacterized protein LOC125505482 n=1 Tax=Dendroctonus ponderosae TaxID=77166 RepID=UPI00203655D3|nr:uncharacterized protein LOC125505482 [Dendroctonus ponderosae]